MEKERKRGEKNNPKTKRYIKEKQENRGKPEAQKRMGKINSVAITAPWLGLFDIGFTSANDLANRSSRNGG